MLYAFIFNRLSQVDARYGCAVELNVPHLCDGAATICSHAENSPAGILVKPHSPNSDQAPLKEVYTTIKLLNIQ